MTWWTSEAIAYTRDDMEGHRLRLLIAEKRARVTTRIDGIDEFPESMNEINPDKVFPVLVDKNLICYGPALDAFIHERFPSPTLLPVDPVKRAQVRMLEADIRAHYDLPNKDFFLDEVQETYNNFPTLFIAGNAISVVDIALAPLLHETLLLDEFEPFGEFAIYVSRLLDRPSFQQSVRSSSPMSPDEQLDEEAT